MVQFRNFCNEWLYLSANLLYVVMGGGKGLLYLPGVWGRRKEGGMLVFFSVSALSSSLILSFLPCFICPIPFSLYLGNKTKLPAKVDVSLTKNSKKKWQTFIVSSYLLKKNSLDK